MHNIYPYKPTFTKIKWGLQGCSYIYHDMIDLREKHMFLYVYKPRVDCDARHSRSLIRFWAKSQKMSLAAHSC